MYISEQDYLMHHGVKGMKWGVRHDKPRTGTGRAQRKRGARKRRSIKEVGAAVKAERRERIISEQKAKAMQTAVDRAHERTMSELKKKYGDSLSSKHNGEYQKLMSKYEGEYYLDILRGLENWKVGGISLKGISEGQAKLMEERKKKAK